MLTNKDLTSIREIVKEEIKPLDRKINKVQKTLDTTITLFDRDIVDLKRKVKVLEDNPNLKLQQL